METEIVAAQVKIDELTININQSNSEIEQSRDSDRKELQLMTQSQLLSLFQKVGQLRDYVDRVRQLHSEKDRLRIQEGQLSDQIRRYEEQNRVVKSNLGMI